MIQDNLPERVSLQVVLLYILRLFAFRPRIVGCYEVHPFLPGGMIEEPDFGKFTRIRVGQVHLSTLLEIVGGDLVGVGHDAVDHLEAIAVCLVLKMAADGVERGSRKKCERVITTSRPGVTPNPAGHESPIADPIAPASSPKNGTRDRAGTAEYRRRWQFLWGCDARRSAPFHVRRQIVSPGRSPWRSCCPKRRRAWTRQNP